MNRSVKSALMAGVAAILLSTPALAQQGPGGPGRGNFDPAQMRQQMMERFRERLEITNDDEWKLIQTRIEKVNEARRQVGFGGGMGMGMGMMGMGRGNRSAGGGNAPQGSGPQANAAQGGNPPPPAAADQGGRRSGRGGFGAEASPEAEALQKAIEAKASAEELKTKLTAYRDARKAKEAALEKAQQELRAVLTVRQEASLVLAGILN